MIKNKIKYRKKNEPDKVNLHMFKNSFIFVVVYYKKNS